MITSSGSCRCLTRTPLPVRPIIIPAAKTAVPTPPSNADAPYSNRSKVAHQKVRQNSPPPATNIAAKKSQKRRRRRIAMVRATVVRISSEPRPSSRATRLRPGSSSMAAGASVSNPTPTTTSRQETSSQSSSPITGTSRKMPIDQKAWAKLIYRPGSSFTCSS
ncbi:hypothetical protein SDC9_188295 [bioreactor metagenome]|uniref:Uncharacterized protein n=1 Tax=bioreactor metagenome TaxID=1076179 RepID=A0A645HQC4_9ZZZZ